MVNTMGNSLLWGPKLINTNQPRQVIEEEKNYHCCETHIGALSCQASVKPKQVQNKIFTRLRYHAYLVSYSILKNSCLKWFSDNKFLDTLYYVNHGCKNINRNNSEQDKFYFISPCIFLCIR